LGDQYGMNFTKKINCWGATTQVVCRFSYDVSILSDFNQNWNVTSTRKTLQ
jgi:exo-beta-1,3-glucanase (GH17 family)